MRHLDTVRRGVPGFWASGLLVLGLLLLPTTGIEGRQADPETSGVPQIRGQVVDDRTGAGVSGATVDFLDGRSTRLRATDTTDVDGYFHLPEVPHGSFRLRVQRLGFENTTTPFWEIERGELLTVEIRIDPEVVVMAPLEIKARVRSASPVLEGFYLRMDRGVGGTFFDREDIRREGPARVSDLVARAPGIRTEPASGFSSNRFVTMTRALPGRGPGGCPVQIFVDGVLATRSGAVPIDELASPTDLEGVEIYRGVGSVPAEFLTPDARCGVIALWTRRGW
ncbi:MAG: hypothetical protein EA352_10280 [Gemmatimonadales bacterium]|nr:MAG: hypothetical protein EA352_10280 [Gemmatimonadales bacterium]